MSQAVTQPPLYSSLGDDPDLGEIVTMFVDEMPARVENLLGLYQSGDRELLGRCAHQIKGTAGSYGFDPISPAAAKLETTVRNGGDEESIYAAVQELAALCRRVRSGAAPISA